MSNEWPDEGYQMEFQGREVRVERTFEQSIDTQGSPVWSFNFLLEGVDIGQIDVESDTLKQSAEEQTNNEAPRVKVGFLADSELLLELWASKQFTESEVMMSIKDAVLATEGLVKYKLARINPGLQTPDRILLYVDFILQGRNVVNHGLEMEDLLLTLAESVRNGAYRTIINPHKPPESNAQIYSIIRFVEKL